MKRTLLLATVLWTVLNVGCETQSEEQDVSSSAVAEAPSGAVASLLDAYESVRGALASDQLPATSHYADLATAARQAAEGYEGTARESLIELSAAAQSAAAQSPAGLSEARLQFGKVSEPLIGFLSAQPELARGRFIFECPMTKGYPKWVQRSETVSNPYLGTEMASCGTATEWAP